MQQYAMPKHKVTLDDKTIRTLRETAKLLEYAQDQNLPGTTNPEVELILYKIESLVGMQTDPDQWSEPRGFASQGIARRTLAGLSSTDTADTVGRILTQHGVNAGVTLDNSAFKEAQAVLEGTSKTLDGGPPIREGH